MGFRVHFLGLWLQGFFVRLRVEVRLEVMCFVRLREKGPQDAWGDESSYPTHRPTGS